MKIEIYDFIETLDACQRIMGETMNTPGELQPLPIPTTIRINISMDFTEGLLKDINKLIIMVVVDHVSKYAQYCSSSHPFIPSTIAQVFIDQIFKLHDMLISIVLDRDPKFTK
jgi:hypothetical protein